MKSSVFITYLILFFSILIIGILMIFAWEILSFYIIKRNWFNSKLSSESLASILNLVFSSTYENISVYLLLPPNDLKVIFSDESITVNISNGIYVSKIFKPSYIYLNTSFLKNNTKECSSTFQAPCPLIIIRDGNEVIIY